MDEFRKEPLADTIVDSTLPPNDDVPLPASHTDDWEANTDAEFKLPTVSFKEAMSNLQDFLTRCDFRRMLLLRLITVYFFVSGSHLWAMREKGIQAIHQWKLFVGEISFSSLVIAMILGTVLLSLLHLFIPKRYRVIDPLLAIGSILYFDIALLWRGNDLYLSLGTAIVSIVLIAYALGKLRTHRWFNKIPRSVCGMTVVIIAAVMAGAIAFFTVYRHKIFGTAAHDFGIFVQMFHSLSENLTAVTTIERDTLMSHFDIHASYIFYLLVPIFKLFPHEETLLISQAVLAMGGVIPLYLIAKHRRFKGVSLISVCLAYVFCASLISPCFYDFHENAFLPTLLMWTLWAVDTKKTVPFYLFSALVCIVKEDAPLYILCIGLYWFFENQGNRKRIHGLIAAVVSGGYLLFITRWLTEHGDGNMMTSSRFGHLLIDPEGGFVEIIVNSLSDPGYLFSLLIGEDTLAFFVQIMFPLLFLPFFTKKIHRFLLILPFVITNLVIGAHYGYAANILYQYIFGPATLLLFMTVINVDDMKPRLKKDIPILLSCAALILSVGTLSYHTDSYQRYQNNIDYYSQVDTVLDSIPSDASIGADAFVAAQLANRSEVYIFDNNDLDEEHGAVIDPERYDFIVLRSTNDFYRTAEPILTSYGFTEWSNVQGRMIVFKSNVYATSES